MHRRHHPGQLRTSLRALLAVVMLVAAVQGPGAACADVADSEPEATLNHLNTLYWVGRTRPWSIYEPEVALRIGAGVDRTRYSDTQLERLDALLSQAEFELAERTGQLGSASIAFGLLVGADDVVEWVDEPLDIAIERALDGLFGDGSRIQMVGQQLVLVTRLGRNAVDEGLDESAIEVMDAWLNANTRAYVLADHERLVEDPAGDSTLSDIDRLRLMADDFGGDRIDLDRIGVVELEFNDEFDGIRYVGAYYRLLDVGTGEWSGEFYADGFAQSARGARPLSILAAILLGIPLAWILVPILRRPRLDPKKELGSIQRPAWWLGLVAVAGGFLSAALIRSGLVAAGPDLTMPMSSVVARGWALGTPLALVVVPLALVYALAPRLPGVAGRIRHADVLSILLVGGWLGAQCHLMGYAIPVLGIRNAILGLAGPTLAGVVVVGALALHWSRWQNDGGRCDFIMFVVAAVAVVVAVELEFGLEFPNLLAASVAPVLLLGLGAAGVSLAPSGSGTSRDSETARDGDGGLREPRYILTTAIEEQFARVREHLVGESSIDPALEMVWIEGARGSGKTRFAMEIADHVRQVATGDDTVPEIVVAIGDCCEPGDPAGEVPFKPFRQALGELLGLSRFSDPTEHSRRLQAGLGKLAGSTVVGGAINLALDLGDKGEDRANLAVVAEQILNAIVSRVVPGAEGGDGCRILLVLDDVQWMDDESFRLFRILLHRLTVRFVEEERLRNRFAIVVTARIDDKASRARVEEIRELVSGFRKDGAIDLLEILEFGTLLSDDSAAEEWLEGWFDLMNATPRARRQLAARFEALGLVLPLVRLEFVMLAFEHGFLRERNGRLDVVPGTRLDSLDAGEEFDQMVEREIEGLDSRLVEVLHCAAVIGREFRPSLLARIFHLDDLELLSLLKGAEDRRIIVDDRASDDRFHFHDKRIAGVFRAAGGARQGDLRQMVREYHARYVEARENELARTGQDPANLPLSEVSQLAHHASMVADRMPVATIIWGDRAAARAERERLWGRALQLITPAIRLVRRESFGVSVDVRIRVLSRHARVVLAAEEELEEAVASVTLARSLSPDDSVSADLENLASLLAYRRRDFAAAEAHAQAAMELSKVGTTSHLRGRFNEILSRAHRESSALQELLQDTRTVRAESQSVPLLELESEILNTLGWSSLYGDDDPEAAANVFQQALELNRDPRILDRKGEAISLSGLGDVWRRRGRDGDAEVCRDEAERCYTANLEISEQDGDQRGVAVMNSKLGALLLERVEAGIAEPAVIAKAARHYETSLDLAIRHADPRNMEFAIQGLTRVGLRNPGTIDFIVDQLPELSSGGFGVSNRDAVVTFVSELRDQQDDEQARLALGVLLDALSGLFEAAETTSVS